MELYIGTRLVHPTYGNGVVIEVEERYYVIYFPDHGEKEISKSFENLIIVKMTEKPEEDTISLNQVESILRDILEPITSPSEQVYLVDKWKGGEMILQPSNKDLQAKSIPIETFFHKIVMVRDRIRVMEQKINASKLTDEEKVDLQQYITRIYGSLTSFNILFRFKEDQFKGAGGE